MNFQQLTASPSFVVEIDRGIRRKGSGCSNGMIVLQDAGQMSKTQTIAKFLVMVLATWVSALAEHVAVEPAGE